MIYPDDQGGWPRVDETDPKKFKRNMIITFIALIASLGIIIGQIVYAYITTR